MFVAPGTKPTFGYKLSRDAAQRIASNWWLLLLNGALLIVAGVLIFSIDWTIRSLATFIGVVFIVQGVAEALTTGIDTRVRRANVVTGPLSIAIGIVIIVWPACSRSPTPPPRWQRSSRWPGSGPSRSASRASRWPSRSSACRTTSTRRSPLRTTTRPHRQPTRSDRRSPRRVRSRSARKPTP